MSTQNKHHIEVAIQIRLCIIMSALFLIDNHGLLTRPQVKLARRVNELRVDIATESKRRFMYVTSEVDRND